MASDRGAPATPLDVSQYATRAQSDARYAAKGTVRTDIALSGADFHAGLSSSVTRADDLGIYFVSPPGAAFATLLTLPVGAVVTGADFDNGKTTGTADQFDLGNSDPAGGQRRLPESELERRHPR